MDPIVEMVDAERYASELSWLKDQCADRNYCSDWVTSLEARAVYSTGILARVRQEIAEAGNQLPDGVAALACGSFGRLEATAESDVDLLVVVDRPCSKISSRLKRTYFAVLKRLVDVITSIQPLAFSGKEIPVLADPNAKRRYLEVGVNRDVFRVWVPIDMLTEDQFDQTDSVLRQVRRISLLLESQPLTSNEFTRRLKRTALDRLYAIDDANLVVPSRGLELLMRDILRFLHSSHHFHFHKTRDATKESSQRFQKLLITRRLLGVSAWLLLLETRHNPSLIRKIFDPPIIKMIGYLKREIGFGGSADEVVIGGPAVAAVDEPPAMTILRKYSDALTRITEYIKQVRLKIADSDDACRNIGALETDIANAVRKSLELRNRYYQQGYEDLLKILL